MIKKNNYIEYKSISFNQIETITLHIFLNSPRSVKYHDVNIYYHVSNKD